jgi:DNA-binding CsgD family transcriptional regulator/ligand-binding sensor domain-containing protein
LSLVFSQELPPIEKFTPEDYGGENQNWMISQASNNFIYVANSGGLLEFNGEKWTMYPSPNNTVIRAVNVVDDRIYTGCFNEFGFWEKDTIGKLEYHSLVQKLKEFKAVGTLDDENIWNIRTYDDWILFQSQKRIYFYNTINESFKIISSENIITKVFNINNSLYYHVINEGIYEIEKGKPKLIVDEDIVKNDRVINIFTFKDQFILQTFKSGFYVLKDSEISIWQKSVNKYIRSMSVFNSIQLKDGSFVLGTISNGIIHVSPEGDVKYQINQKKGLSNNTALSLFEDKDENVWVGLDNGINCININSPVKVFNDDEGVLGTVYTSSIFNNYLYLGTNQGLFYKDLGNDKNYFQFMEGTAGQVWSLFVFNKRELLCGSHTGTYIIDKDKATKIDNTPGTWNFRPVSKTENNLLQGNYRGLYVLSKKNGSWFLNDKVEGFDYSARYFEINNENEVWISHGYKGVFKLKLEDNLTKATNTVLEPGITIGNNSSLIKYKNDILYANQEGIFKYDTIKRIFIYDSLYSPLIEKKNYLSGKLVVTEDQKLWAFSKDNINYLTTNNLTNKLKLNQISIPVKLRKGMVGYENISLIRNNEYLIGTSNGYITIDLSKINYSKEYKVILNSVSLKGIKSKKIEFNSNKNGEFGFRPGLISFNYSVPEYDKYLIVKYQYKVEGHFSNWSDWTENSEASFENLFFGDYTFKVRAKIGNELSSNISVYNFKVNKPWFLSNTALIGYIVLFFLTILLIHKAYRIHYNKQHKLKQSANEELIVRIKNEKLEQDIESKNRELAISTMSIIKKNEVLNSIKKELKNISFEPTDSSRIVRLIDANINNKKDWEFFEEAFNNADKHFLDKAKAAYPDLTPNDLRFCAYLRLNLSSKEIAPLLNISVRSVETKRYRIRKKMNLPHDDSLVNHILEI